MVNPAVICCGIVCLSGLIVVSFIPEMAFIGLYDTECELEYPQYRFIYNEQEYYTRCMRVYYNIPIRNNSEFLYMDCPGSDSVYYNENDTPSFSDLEMLGIQAESWVNEKQKIYEHGIICYLDSINPQSRFHICSVPVGERENVLCLWSISPKVLYWENTLNIFRLFLGVCSGVGILGLLYALVEKKIEIYF